MNLSQEEQKQYNRHLILNEIGGNGQLKLKKAKVLVIGAGGLGCPILQYLTAAGVGTIGIIDHDTIDQSNLQRQILYAHEDIGNYKVEVAAKKLAGLNPFINFKPYTQKLNSAIAIELFSLYDIIVDGSDNFPTRYLVNDASVLTNKPVVSGSIFKFEGQVSVFNYLNGPTYRCLFPSPPKSEEVPNCSEIGVLGVLPGIIGSLQANEVIKIICGIGNVLTGKLLIYDALTLQQSLLSFEKNENIQINSLDGDYNAFCGVNSDILEISLKELEQASSYNLLDVRTSAERNDHHLGGQHIPLDQLKQRSHEICQDKPLIVYCKSGIRSKEAIKLLKQLGFSNQLINLKF
jgi:molybdopterin/thiamine biosynthesis adenylyltransferase/rhodanese-related sulfurtransferase